MRGASYRRRYWSVLWVQDNLLDGKVRQLVFDHEIANGPVLFDTRAKARKYRDSRYGYIRAREDLKREPHGWKLPRVVRVQATYVTV
jgi:hypothetical protein